MAVGGDALGLTFGSYNNVSHTIWVITSAELTDVFKTSIETATVTVTDITGGTSKNVSCHVTDSKGIKLDEALDSGVRTVKVEVTANDVTESFTTSFTY